MTISSYGVDSVPSSSRSISPSSTRPVTSVGTFFQKYDWRGRARKDHCAAIRGYLGFRAFTAADGGRLDEWLFHEVIPFDQSAQSLTEAVLGWCRDLRIEPPSPAYRSQRKDCIWIGRCVRCVAGMGYQRLLIWHPMTASCLLGLVAFVVRLRSLIHDGLRYSFCFRSE